ncbi:MAG: mechanosensitive ion channel, partial [Candidatus Dadabacteria bacterium]|nr:mechanosensitive ion channel [Candidatus Dadabacteria bacterium]
MDFTEILKFTYLGNSLQNWILAVVVAIIITIVLTVFSKILIHRLKKHAEKTKTELDDLVVDLLSKTNFIIVIIFAIFIGSLFLDLNKTLLVIRRSVVIIAILVQVALWGNGIISYIVKRKIGQYAFETSGPIITQIKAMGLASKIALWLLISLLILDNLGFNVTALIAGLGIGGIAVALALQNVLGDLIASLSIILDKPFVVGDFIVLDGYMGSVEHIGLKTTRLRSLSGEQLVFSNNDLLQSRLRNYKRMYERRIVFTIGVTYQTPAKTLEKIPQWIKQIIEDKHNARFDRSHFASYGDFSLNFETVYYITSPDYNVYMDTQQNINMDIYRKFEQEGV